MPPVARLPGPLTHAELKEQLHYDPETGHFTWLVRKPRIRPGLRAGNEGNKGYWVIHICGREYKAHVLAWFWMTGEWPPVNMIVDHKNRITGDTCWDNLRLATHGQNQINSVRYGDDKTITSYRSRRKGMRYVLRMRAEGRNQKRTFDTLEEAIAERKLYQSRIWGAEFVT